MYTTIKRFDEVWTSDKFKLGVARSLHYRPPDQVDIGTQLYPVYVEVENYELGDSFFIPIEFLRGRETENDNVLLNATMKQVMDRTWTRMPDFVAKLEGRRELLPEDGEEETPDLA